MALRVKIERVITYKKIWLLFFFFVMLLIIFALAFMLILVIGGHSTLNEFVFYYIDFAAITIGLPFILALTTSLSYKTSIMHITPANNVNIDMLKDFFLTKANYKIIEEKDGFIKFERKKVLPRILWLNIDKPTIEVKENEVRVILEKHTETILTPLLVYGKKYDLHPDN